MEILTQTFKGIITPVRIDHTNGNGGIIPIIDWNVIAQKHIPFGAISPQFELILEYLTLTHYLPTLLRIPGSEYPTFSARDGAAQRGSKLVTFKQKFSAEDNYAVQFILWDWWNGDWRTMPRDRDYLQNAGLEGRINLIKPFLVTAGDTVYGDRLHKLGMSIAPRYLQEGDFIEISGGYSGSISYGYEKPEPKLELAEAQSGERTVGGVPIQVIPPLVNRATLYCSNDGEKRVYFRFTNSLPSSISRQSPFLEPGESLTVENGELIYPGGNSHNLPKLALYNELGLVCACVAGETSRVCYQELMYVE